MSIKGRHIDALDLCNLMQKFLLCQALFFCRAITFDDLRRAVFSFSDGKKINKIRQRLRIDRAYAARKYNVFQSIAVFGQQRNLRQFQHVQNIGIAHLIAQRKRDHIKVTDRVMAFQCPEWNPMRTHFVFHIAPRRKDTFTPDAGHLVHYAVENPHANVGHTDLIGIRKTERNTHIDVLFVFDDLIIFSAHIARRLLDAHEDSVELICHG